MNYQNISLHTTNIHLINSFIQVSQVHMQVLLFHIKTWAEVIGKSLIESETFGSTS